MGLLIEDTVSILGKRPLQYSGVIQPCRPGNNNERYEALSHRPPLVEEPGYALCQVFPTTDDALEQAEAPTHIPFIGGDRTFGGDAAVAPTPDDYANLFFCEPFEEEETRANLALVATEQSSENSEGRTSQSRGSHPHPAAAVTVGTSTAYKRQKKRRKRVSFGAAIPTFHLLHQIPPSHAMTSDERSALWFGRADLTDLKTSAQLSIQDIRRRINAAGDAAQYKDRANVRALMLKVESATGSSIRGLEHRVFRRKQARQVLVRDVLDCQTHANGLARFGHGLGEQERAGLLARVSAERSRKARAAAFVDARVDYEELYAVADAAADGARACKWLKRAGKRASR